MKLNHNTERLHAIKGFDLNLLTMFESVYIHGSITKAAGILGLPPFSRESGYWTFTRSLF